MTRFSSVAQELLFLSFSVPLDDAPVLRTGKEALFAGPPLDRSDALCVALIDDRLRESGFRVPIRSLLVVEVVLFELYDYTLTYCSLSAASTLLFSSWALSSMKNSSPPILAFLLDLIISTNYCVLLSFF